MIIDKRAQYCTEQDERERDEAEAQRKLITTEMLERLKQSKDPENDAELKRIQRQFEEATRREDEIYNRVLERYYKGRGKKQLLADAEEVINAVEKEDYQLYVKHSKNELSAFMVLSGDQGKRSELYDVLRERTQENYQNCFNFILRVVAYQIEGLHRLGDDQGKDKIKALIDKRVSLWYINKRPVYSNTYHEKGLDTITYMSAKNAVIDDISRKLIIEKPGVKLKISETIENQGKKIKILDFDNLGGALPLSTKKLLSKALIEFTKQNSAHSGNLNRNISISLKEYAEDLGYDVTEKYTATPEEAERERKRVKNQLDNIRKVIQGDLNRLHAYVITTEDKKTHRLDNYSIVSHTGYKNWIIYIDFTEEIATALVENNLITKFPTALFKIDGKNETSYQIGKYLSDHYTMDGNRVRGSNNIISVKKILENSSKIPTYEEVQKTDPGHWEARIKEPILTALDVNKKAGVITDCKFVHAGGVDLTDEEYNNIKTYEQFISLYLWYEMPNPGDEERIQAKQENRRKAIAKKKRAKKKRN